MPVRPPSWGPEVVQSPLCTCNVRMTKMSVADQLAMYDRSFFIAMSSPNIMQKADMMYAYLCSSSSDADGVMRLSTYTGSCANMSFPGSPGSSILSF